MKKLKILEVTAFSAGVCGVWARVAKEAELLAEKGNDVYIFSSNIYRGSGKIEYAQPFEKIKNIKIYRFKTRRGFGENTFFWDYTKKALKLKPDIIICHVYRQYYSTIALRIAKKLKIPCILVTHAPFPKKELRNWKLNLTAWFYDKFIGRIILNKYFKIFTITRWEIPYLLKLGVNKNKMVCIPNGIPKEFFKIKLPKKKLRKEKNIMFLGRISPIKDIETLIKAFSLCLKEDKNFYLSLVGPVEEYYGKKIENLIRALDLNKRIKFYGPVFNLKKKIEIIDSSDLFVLPSKSEAFGIVLLEAMSRNKLVIASSSEGAKEIIQNGKTGLIFKIGNFKELANKIRFVFEEKNASKIEKIRKRARQYARAFSWDKIIRKIEEKIYDCF